MNNLTKTFKINVRTYLLIAMLFTVSLPLTIIALISSFYTYYYIEKQTNSVFQTLLEQAMARVDTRYETDLESLSYLANNHILIKAMSHPRFKNIHEEIINTDYYFSSKIPGESPVREIIEQRLKGTCFIYENDQISFYNNTPYKLHRFSQSLEPVYTKLVTDPLYQYVLTKMEGPTVMGKLQDGVIRSLGKNKAISIIYRLRNPEGTYGWDKFILYVMPPDTIYNLYKHITQLKMGTLYFLDPLGNVIHANHPYDQDDYDYDESSGKYINDYQTSDQEMTFKDYQYLVTDPDILKSLEFRNLQKVMKNNTYDFSKYYYIKYKSKKYLVKQIQSQFSGIQLVFFYPVIRMHKPIFNTIALILSFTLMILLIFIGLTILFSHRFTEPIRTIINQTQKYQITGEINDLPSDYFLGEFRTLSTTINNLNRQINTHQMNLLKIIDHYSLFLPKEYFNLLNKNSVLDMKLGDQVNKEMTFLFSDIRNFTSMSESMSPVENFNFLNSYFKRMGPLVRKNHGFIDKYIGDAIMALFTNDANDAIQTAIDMTDELVIYNEQRKKINYVPISIGIGINTGYAMFGIIGEKERHEGTVISDAVNLASRLENLNKDYGTRIIFSMYTLIYLNYDKYLYRVLDQVMVKGKTETTIIFELLTGLSDQEIEIKLKTKESYEEAVLMIQECNYPDALKQLKSIKKINPSDLAIDFQINKCIDKQILRRKRK